MVQFLYKSSYTESACAQFQAKLALKKSNCHWLIIWNIENIKRAKKPDKHQEFFLVGGDNYTSHCSYIQEIDVLKNSNN